MTQLLVTKECEQCHITFDVVHTYRSQRTCSLECAKLLRRRGQAHLVKRTCEWCSIEFEVPYKIRTQRFCCASHARKKSWNLGLTVATSDKLRETINKSNSTKARLMSEGKLCVLSRGVCSEHISPKAGRCWCRSTYEKRYCELLDTSQDVRTYRSEPMYIPYSSGETVRNYVPDFLVTYLDGSCVLVEVKPMALVNLPGNVVKINAARNWCAENGMKFLVITERELYPQ